MKVVADMVKRAVAAVTQHDIEKRQGVYVSRKLEARNAKKWHDWAVKYGVPNVLPPEEMHVTIIYSPEKDAKVPLVETTMNIATAGGLTGGCFAMFGKDEDHLVFTFRAWDLHDRHWIFLEAGCICEWPYFRPHVTLSNDAAGFELPDEALQDVPAWLVLGPEQAEAPKKGEMTAVELEATDSRIEVAEAARTIAAELVKAGADNMPVIDVYDLMDIAHGRLTTGVAKRLGVHDWASGLKAALPAEIKVEKKRVEREMTISVSAIPEDIAKKLATTDLTKTNDEEQIVMGIASVSTIDGQLVTDSHGDEITTRALTEFNRSLISGSRAGKVDHEGEVVTEVVAGLVLSYDWQKSLGIELGFEPYLVEIHVPDAQLWAEVKDGDWMLSIAGTMWHYE